MVEVREPRRDAGRRPWTLMLLVLSGALIATAVWLGVSDNPPGILLVHLAAASFVLAFVHRWRVPRRFLWLMLLSVAGFVVFAVLHNLLDAIGENLAGVAVLGPVLSGLAVLFFLLAIFVCPPAAIIGAVGVLVSGVARRGKE